MFYLCGDLKRVVLNEGLKELGYDLSISGTFQDSGIEEVTFPSTLKWIGERTFFYCGGLRKIYVRSGCRANLSRLNRPSSAQIVWIGGELGASREAS